MNEVIFLVMILFGGPENKAEYFHEYFLPQGYISYEVCLGDLQLLEDEAATMMVLFGVEEEWRIDCIPPSEVGNFPVVTQEEQPLDFY